MLNRAGQNTGYELKKNTVYELKKIQDIYRT